MISKFKRILDPLDREVLERALDEAWTAAHAKANALIESGSDEELEALLRRELMEIASINGLDGEQRSNDSFRQWDRSLSQLSSRERALAKTLLPTQHILPD